MTRAIRSFALAAAAAALLSSQAVYAAPARSAPAVDPLVSLSLLGTAQSRAAVCGASATCGLPMMMAGGTTTMSATTAVQQDDDTLPPPPPPPGKSVSPLLAILGMLVLVGIAVALLTGDDDATGDLAPISP